LPWRPNTTSTTPAARCASSASPSSTTAGLRGLPVDEPEDYYRGDYVKDLARELLEKEGPGLVNLPEGRGRDRLPALRRTGNPGRHQKGSGGFPGPPRRLVPGIDPAGRGRGQDLPDLQAKNLATTRTAPSGCHHHLGDDKDRVLVKSGGELTYFASDIAYHDDKFKRGFDVVVDIWGADHHGYVPRMKAWCQPSAASPKRASRSSWSNS
jgi:arginyl-tRNA synthetase